MGSWTCRTVHCSVARAAADSGPYTLKFLECTSRGHALPCIGLTQATDIDPAVYLRHELFTELVEGSLLPVPAGLSDPIFGEHVCFRAPAEYLQRSVWKCLGLPIDTRSANALFPLPTTASRDDRGDHTNAAQRESPVPAAPAREARDESSSNSNGNNDSGFDNSRRHPASETTATTQGHPSCPLPTATGVTASTTVKSNSRSAQDTASPSHFASGSARTTAAGGKKVVVVAKKVITFVKALQKATITLEGHALSQAMADKICKLPQTQNAATAVVAGRISAVSADKCGHD